MATYPQGAHNLAPTVYRRWTAQQEAAPAGRRACTRSKADALLECARGVFSIRALDRVIDRPAQPIAPVAQPVEKPEVPGHLLAEPVRPGWGENFAGHVGTVEGLPSECISGQCEESKRAGMGRQKSR
jgi:hypothetical protein